MRNEDQGNLSRGCTVNIGNFENEKIEISATAELDDDEDPNKAILDLRKQIAGWRKEIIDKIQDKLKAREKVHQKTGLTDV